MTLERIQALTDDEIRVRVAELRGWVHYASWHHPDIEEPLFTPEPPNYPADLNACAEFERILSTREASEYNRTLQSICLDAPDDGPASDYGWHASARQRCEAFLATMGKDTP